MSIIVTGAYGQLGGELCRQLGDRAIGLDIDSLDLTDGDAVHKRMLELRPRAIINCAAYTLVDRAEEEPELCRAVNAEAVGHLARACGELDCPLVQISTDYVFGASPDSARPWREDDPPSPRGVYARTKLEGERLAARHPKHYIVRTCGLYARAGDEKAKNFVRTMLRLGETRSELRVVDDQRCTPTYVPHLARALLFLLGDSGPLKKSVLENPGATAGLSSSVFPGKVACTAGQASSGTLFQQTDNGSPSPWGTYHVTNAGETTWREFAIEIFRQAGLQVSVSPITTAEYGAAAPRPSYSVLDTNKYHRLGGPAMPDWKTAVAEYFCDAASGG